MEHIICFSPSRKNSHWQSLASECGEQTCASERTRRFTAHSESMHTYIHVGAWQRVRCPACGRVRGSGVEGNRPSLGRTRRHLRIGRSSHQHRYPAHSSCPHHILRHLRTVLPAMHRVQWLSCTRRMPATEVQSGSCIHVRGWPHLAAACSNR